MPRHGLHARGFLICNMHRLLLALLLLTTTPALTMAKGKAFVFTPGMVEAYHHVMALRFDKGLALLEEEKKKDAENPALAFVSDYHYFLKSFINEDVKAFYDEISAFNKRFKVLEDGEQESPYYYYTQAELLVHQAALRFKFRDYVRGAANVRDAYQLLKKNIAKYPDFLPHYKSLGMLEVLVGTVPPKFSWVTDMLGMKGDIEGGMVRIENFMNAPPVSPEVDMLKEEALFLYSFLQLHIVKEKEEAWRRVELATRDYRSNLLHCYARASVGMHCKKTGEVIHTLMNRPNGDEYARFYFLDYMLGSAKLYRQDKDAAIYFKVFVTYFKGENYIKDAYLKLAWNALCQGDERTYDIYMGMVKSQGKSNVDEDKQALKEATSGLKPHTGLLKARLLFDGGFYEQALQILNPLVSENWTRGKDKAEYYYRAARIYDEKGDKDKALQYYEETIALCRNEPWYFAANSSLHIGYIYEARGDKPKALAAFQQAMNFPNDEYKNSIDQKAKAGIQRVNES